MATFLLIPGGFCGGWYWSKVTTCLEAKNHKVYAPTLTGLGDRQHLCHAAIDLETHIEDINNVIYFEDLDDLILVGHSYGGLVMAGVASTLCNKICQLIYIDALIPRNGDSLFSLVDKELVDFFYSQANEKGAGWLIPPYPVPDSEFDSISEASRYKSRFTPQPLKTFSQPIQLDNQLLDTIPSSYIYCSQNSYPMIKMREMAKNNGWHCFDLESNHFPMLTKHEQLVDLLIRMIQ